MLHLRCVSLLFGDIGAYCNTHIGLLVRALLNSRGGFEKSNNLIRFLTRRVIQLGLFATIWSLAAMGTWFLMPRYNIYAFFDFTSGPVYTHVSEPLP